MLANQPPVHVAILHGQELSLLPEVFAMLRQFFISRFSLARQQSGRYIVHAGHQLNASEFR